MSIISIHQPEHLPWLGYFDKMKRVETFVILDDVQFRKNYFQNRNRICLPSGEPSWLTVPIAKFKSCSHIKDISITDDESWKSSYIKKIEQCYCKSKNYTTITRSLYPIIENADRSLSNLNIDLIEWLKNLLSISARLVRSSELGPKSSSQDINLQINRALCSRRYLSGPMGKAYLNLNDWERDSIDVVFHSYASPKHMIAADGTNFSSLHYFFEHW